METIKKKFFYTATYHLPSDSVLRNCIIKDPVIDEDGFINIFENDKYKILIANDIDGNINCFIYKSIIETDFIEVNLNEDICSTKEINDQFNMFKSNQEIFKDFYVNTQQIDEKSLEKIEWCINRFRIAFYGLKNFVRQDAAIDDHKLKTFVYLHDYDSQVKLCPPFVCTSIGYSSSSVVVSQTLSCQEIISVLKVNKDNIDEYIRRFLILEKLNSDPVLTLITLFALYEYIKESNPADKRLERILLKTKKVGYKSNLEEKFRNTRHLVAHGFAGGNDNKQKQNTTKILEECLENCPPDPRTYSYSFDRYNPSHMKIVNEVISEVQPIIHNYLKEELGIKK